MGEHDQDIQNLKSHGRHHEEVDRDEFFYMSVEKGFVNLSLLSRNRSPDKIAPLFH